MQKSSVVLFTLLSLLMALTACVQVPADGATGASSDGDAMPAIRIGLITDVGEVDDKSFNQSAWEGAQAAAEALGGTAEFIETKDAKDYADNIAEFADDGYEVIVTVGFAMGEATAIAAAEYPDTKFIGVDQFQVPGNELPNLAGLIFNEDQSGYLAGILAANMTESNTIAAVLGNGFGTACSCLQRRI